MAAPCTLKTIAALTFGALTGAVLAPTAIAGCSPGQTCSSWTSAGAATPDIRSLPSTITQSEISNMRLNGLGPNERLCPTQCPVSVETPKNGQVLACYKICTPVGSSAGSTASTYAAASSSSSVQSSSHYSQESSMYTPPEVEHHYEFTYHPVIYVHYPVPILVYGLPVPCRTCTPSRYGY